MSNKALYADRRAMQPTVPLAQDRFVYLSDEWPHNIASACPLTNLVLSKGWYTPNGLLEADELFDNAVITAIQNNYDVAYQDINTFISAWDGVLCEVPTIELLEDVIDTLEAGQ